MPIKYVQRAPGTMFGRLVPVFEEPLTDDERAERDRRISGDYEGIFEQPTLEWSIEVLGAAGITINAGSPTIDGRKAERGVDYDVDSAPDFALRMIRFMYEIDQAIQANDARRAARWAVELGQAHALAMAKFMWEPAALRGRKVRTAARQGHETVHGTPEEKRARWRVMADDFRKERAAGKDKGAAEQTVADRRGVSERTIRRAVRWAETTSE